MRPLGSAVSAAICARVFVTWLLRFMFAPVRELSEYGPEFDKSVFLNGPMLHIVLCLCVGKKLQKIGGARSESEPTMPLKKPAACIKTMKLQRGAKGAKTASKGSRLSEVH